ncbi:histone-lysine N-methyltransferase 2C isoform X5 [Lepisosteus oculatus]|uniref:histone-lysine N-methyltransferase 2C isoform X5 n=1 Tax=Lepisosteus oculatus TaxID=7918 RepID=UPI0037224095
MSSEDKTLEPSDQGPSPPPSSTAATPAGSPANTDKRPRGRPRKDGVAPTQKSKKKSRSRGKASVDDEDSMDGVETAEMENFVETEAKEPPAESDGVQSAESTGEEKPPSPVLQRSASEESAGSSALAADEAKSSEQLCAFCYCGERSLLGQGELKLFVPTPGYILQHVRKKRESTDIDGDGDRSPKHSTTGRRQRGQKKDHSSSSSALSSGSGSTEAPCEEQASKYWEELSQVGLPDDIDVESLFDTSGQCWAHQCCALWSGGVCQEQGHLLVNVDRAIDSGSTEYCAYCKRLGASIKCCEEMCRHSYHYPCAAAAGTFQDIRSCTLLCPEHIELAIERSKDEVNCAVCDSPGDLQDQLFCTSCGQHYHGMCLDIVVTPLKRAGWQCPECKVCQTCKNPGEDSKMLVCDTCDKGYHTFCLQPVMDSIPTNGWRCKNCRVCVQCGTRTSSQWHHNCLLCDSCYQQQDAGMSCPLCGKALPPDVQKDMLSCQVCKRWIHLECERQAEGESEMHVKEDYVCTICKQVELELTQMQAGEHQGNTGSTSEPGTAIAEDTETEEIVQQEQVANKFSLNEERKNEDCTLVIEPAQEIQVTVTVTEPAELPEAPAVPVEAPQLPVAVLAAGEVEERREDMEITESEKVFMELPSEKVDERQQSEELKQDVKSPTKETVYEPAVTAQTEPMVVSAPEQRGTDGTVEPVVPESEVPAAAADETKPVRDLPDEKEASQVCDVSPVVEMDTTPASERSFSDMNSPTEDKALKQSPEMPYSVSSDSSKLAQSPFSVGASPKESSHAQNFSVASGYNGSAASTTFIPVAPKIGMGKPAITKRKFSPGRPRVKQGAWSTPSAVSSPSWSPDRSEGWETPKTRQPSSTPIWTVKVGRGSGFPGKRRPRGASLSGRGGRGRSKMKNGIGPVITPGVNLTETYSVKDEEENSMHNTVVLFSSSDRFTLKQDMCVVCGSFGQGAEGRLLACSQCGQCYHPYCVSIKITRVVLSKGWRCLECTVCEACGKASDPGRLLLCDDCDISYHTYCLEPPLQTVPKGSWKCKWCVSCTNCGATSPGLRCEWQNNYTQCAPCASLAVCPVCCRNYREDELIVQCRQCDRWIHATCQNLNTEEEVENAADNSFDCTMCRARMTPCQGMEGSESPILAQIVTKMKEQDPPKTYTQDGVCLTELGLSQLQSLSVMAPRRKRPKPKLKLKIINQNSVAVLQTPPDPQSEHSRDGEMDDSREGDLLDCDGKSDSSPEREPADDDSKGAEGADGIKKRKRKPYRPGIGGFMVRQRSRTGQGKTKRSLSRKDSTGSVSENLAGKEEGWNEQLPETPVEETVPGSECLEKAKKRYRKKKNKLEETFPTYLQEAFFGKDLLDTSRQNRLNLESNLSDEDPTQAESKPPSANTSFLDPSSDPLLSAATTTFSSKGATQPNSEDPLAVLSEVLSNDDDILGILSDDLVKPGDDSGLDLCTFQVENSPSPFAGLDIVPIADDPSAAPQQTLGRSVRSLPEEPLDGILSPELDKMVTDGAILSKLYKIPELEGKDVEDLFTAVLSPSTSQPPQLSHPAPPPPPAGPAAPGPPLPLPNPGDGMFPRMPVMNGLMGPAPHFPTAPMNPAGGPCIPGTFSPIHRMPFPDAARDKKHQFTQVVSDPVGSWPPPVPAAEGEADTMSSAQRSTLKWEKEETLGDMATVAPVLYTNVNFPNLKEEFPDWSTRVKQIAKLWRKASSQERAPYVQKARDNRAALRINKVQMSNDSMKRQPHPPDIYDLVEPEPYKETLKHKESEHEQEWKFRQEVLCQMCGPLKKQQEKIPKSKAITSNKEVLFGHSNQASKAAGCGKYTLQMRQKSKQQAKIEATQKLEQVKSEQQQQQQQQLQQQQQQQQFTGQSGSDTPTSGNQSPLTPQPSNGSMSPAQQMTSKDAFARPQLPSTPTSGASDDVFLRPQPPPPAATRMPAQDSCSQAQSTQPQSPQVFSPGSSSSRPSSPWDPYAKMVGTPRPPPIGSGAARRNSVETCNPPPVRPTAEQQERGNPSPAHESFGSPTSMSNDPYAKPPDTPRPVMSTEHFVKPMVPPRSMPAPESPGKHPAGPGHRAEVYQRMSHNRMILSDPYTRPLLTPVPGSNESGSVPLFKTPMPPPSQDPYNSVPSTQRRLPVDPYERQVLTPRPPDSFNQNQLNDPYAHPPLTPRPAVSDSFPAPPRMMRHPQGDPFSQLGPAARLPSRDPYAQAPSTPRPVSDSYSQVLGASRPPPDPYAQPPGTPRPSSDPYSQPPSTPRQMSDPYAQSPSTPRPSAVDQYPQQQQPPHASRPSPSHSADPYAQPPGTPRPVMGERYSKSPVSQRNSDPYAHPPGTPRPAKNDPYSQPPGTPRPVLNDPYAQPPGTPRPGASEVFNRPVVCRPGQMPNPDPFSSPPQNRGVGGQETFLRPAAPGPQTLKHSVIPEDGFAPPQPNQTPIHDPFEQASLNPRPQSGERLALDVNEQQGTGHEGNYGVSPEHKLNPQAMGQFCNIPQTTGAANEPNSVQQPQGDTEEKLRQRQRLRELILRQQQQKSAIRQEKGLQEPAIPAAAGAARPWSQDEAVQQSELFNRPPPPYPGTARGPLMPGAPRFPGPFAGEPRGPFAGEVQFNRPQFPGDVGGMGMRPHGPRFGFPTGGQGPLAVQEHFMRPPHQMQGQILDVPPQMRRSLSVDLVRPMGNNPMGLPQHFPPRGMPMQQHNIMGQPFIELRHRAPESRLRLPFNPSVMTGNVMDPSLQPQRPVGFMSGQEMVFPAHLGPRMMEPIPGQPPGMAHIQMSSSLENIAQNPVQMNAGQPHAPLMRSLSHPSTNDTFSVAPSMLLPPAPAEPAEEIPIASSEGIEEKLDTDDSAVKDLDDVEVKDLDDEDLENLNLEDGKADDLDLETNDLHLDDFLRSGKFDIIAYTDPELDLGDKKDMFNEELDLSDPIDDQAETAEEHKASGGVAENKNAASVSAVPCQTKTETVVEGKTEKTPEKPQDNDNLKISSPNKEANLPCTVSIVKAEVKECLIHTQECCSSSDQTDRLGCNQENTGDNPSISEASAQLSAQPSGGSLSGSTPVLSSLLIKDKPDDTGLIDSPNQSDLTSQSSQVTGTQQNPAVIMTPGQVQDHVMNPSLPLGQRINPGFSQGAPLVNPNFVQGQHPCQNFGAGQPVDQTIPNNMPAAGAPQAMFPHSLNQQNRERPLLLDEQPLLLQDLLDQERQEQQQQRQMQAMIRQRSNDSFFPNIDFDAITDPIMKAKMVALKGINKVMSQNNLGMPPMVMNRFPFVGQQMPSAQSGDGSSLPQQAVGQDGKLAPQMARPNPPNFGPGFVNDAQKKQYEEWLQKTQQLLQIQQKFLEEEIGAHRKSKKALSAKQRTAKKAGREFPEEDAEQLKHVTEQQSVVQKQLEQIRKQQKEHAELIEEYRIKQQQQQQCTMQPALMQGIQAQAPMVPGGPAMGQQNFPMMPQQMPPHPGQPSPARMPNAQNWHPGAPVPLAGARMPAHIPPQIPANPAPPAQAPLPGSKPVPAGAAAGNGAPHVKFDDNNPFSEGFQERERKERLREQQERQRIQLMQEVERQRALKQRLEMEQQGMVGPDLNRAPLSQMPYFNPDMSPDFMQPQRPPQPTPQQQLGQMFPQQQNMQQGFVGSPPGTPFMQGAERRPVMGNGPFGPDMTVGGPGFRAKNPALQGANFTQGPPRPPGFGGPGIMPQGAAEGPPFGMEPATPLPPNYPGSGPSLIQLYSNIIPEEKGKKKRNRKKKKDDDADSVKTPSTPHSDLTAPLTPCVSDTASTPTQNAPADSLLQHQGDQDTAELLPGSSTPGSLGSQPPSELERQLSGSSSSSGGGGGGGRGSGLSQTTGRPSSGSSEADRGQQEEPHKGVHEIKVERVESSECHTPKDSKVEQVQGIVKLEDGKEGTPPHVAGQSPAHSTDGTGTKLESGNELLKHLLKNKNAPSLLSHQKSDESLRSEDEGSAEHRQLQKQGSADGAIQRPTANQMPRSLGLQGPQLQRAEQDPDKKKQRNKRAPKGSEKPASRSKKRKKEEEERPLVYSNTDTLMTQLKQQLSLLPLMEPLIGVNFAHFPPYGSGQLNGENRLSGTFGSASLDGVSDYYSQLIYKQNNLSNPPTPPASLPPTPPPVSRQKMVNGFATAEELTNKAAVMGGHDVTKSLGPKQFQMPFRPEEDLLARAIAQGPKTVDVPASLPTPPHNNQEELRGQEHCEDRDTPDSFVPSSSPESVVGMEVSRYPDLSLVKEEPPDPAPSPIIPMLPSSSGKGSEARQNNVKMEPSGVFFGSQFGPSQNCSKTGLVSIAITLNPAAAENIHGVVAAVADLLCVKIPNSYEVSNAPDRGSLAFLNSLKVHQQNFEPRPQLLFQGPGPNHSAVMRFMRPSGPVGMLQPQLQFHPSSTGSAVVKGDPGLKPQWCCHCKVVVLGNGVRKSTKDLPSAGQDSRDGPGRTEGNMVFCSHNCFVLYCTAIQSKTTEAKEAITVLSDSKAKEATSKTLHQYSNNTSMLDVHCLPQLQPKESPPLTPPITFPTAALEAAKIDAKPDVLKVTVKLKPRPRAVHNAFEDSRHAGKRWKGMRWRKWSVQIVLPKGNFKLPCEDEIDELLQKLGTSLRPELLPKDHRKCCFCHEEGDGMTDGPARLLNLDLDLWVHLNCALWSTEVYETQAGALINVELALRRGLSMKCVYCQKMGATSGCHRLRCTNIYHFTCALKAQCMFFKDKTMLCHMHRPRGGTHEHELRYFAVFRRVYVQRDEVRQIASIVQRGERDHTFRVGSLIFHAIGQLLPHQMQAFHGPTAIYPVGYEASRLYWSMRYSNRRCRYLCSIDEKDSKPEFTIRVVEQGYEDLVLTDSTPKGVWDKVLEPVAERRNESGTLKLFPVYLKGEDLFGLTVSAVTRIAESLPGVEACENYTFRYGRNPLMELPLAINPTGCARSEPKMSSHVKRPHTLNSTSTSKSFQSTVTGELNAPYSKQFVHSKSSQYRKMKTEWKSNVYLARSRIQGLGLYAARDIEKYTMVIEYIGTIIRNEVANRKEKLYESQNRGVYMFRIDSEHVIDATLTGGPARYINHSCAPNCIAEVVTFERGHKIIISSNRRIQKGEELCYDYKFDFEDDQHKIPCHCGAVNCRKWMN